MKPSQKPKASGTFVAATLCVLVATTFVTIASAEEQVNVAATGDQYAADITALDDGRFVVTWASAEEEGIPIVASARFLDMAASPVGAEFQLSSANAFFPRAAAQPGGGFVAVWNELENERLVGRRYDSTGAPLGGEFQVQDDAGYPFLFHQLESDATGDFIVAWQSVDSKQVDPTELRTRRFEADGTPKEASQVLTTFGHPALDVRPDGSYLVAWCSYIQNFGGTRFQRFDPSGDPLGEVTTASGDFCSLVPDIVHRDDGSFLVTWTRIGAGQLLDVEARLFSVTGAALGPAFQVNVSDPDGHQQFPVAELWGKEFIIAWSSTPAVDDDGPYSHRLQRLDTQGELVGSQIVVDDFPSTVEFSHSIARGQGGVPAVAWSSTGSSGSDQDGLSVQVRGDFDRLFTDGFESGDLTRWSVTVP